MKYAPTSFSLSILIAGLLAGTSMVSPTSVAAAASDLQAQTGWAITRVASMTQGSYCTMAQKFSNDTVMTIAKNNDGEYSLAFDFQSPKFEAGKAIPASVKAGTGSSQTFEVQPSSPQVVVIGLGKDDAFIADVKASEKIQLDVDGTSYNFSTVKFAEAQDEMAACMSSMKPQLREAKNADAPQEKTVAKAGEKAKAVAAPVASASKLSAEDLTAAPVEPLAVSSASAIEPAASASEESLAEENARLKQALNEARRSYENQMTSQQGAIVPELQEKISILDKENAGLKAQLAKAETKPQDKQEMTRLAAELDKARQDLSSASEQNKTLQTQLTAAAAEKQNASKATQTAQLSQREAEALKAENQTLKNQLQIAAKADAKVEPKAEAKDSSAEVAKLQQENTALKSELADAAKKAAAVAPVGNTAQDQEISYLRAENEKLLKQMGSKPAGKQGEVSSIELQKRLSELQAENATLKTKLADASDLTPMPSAAPVAPLSATEQDSLRGQLRDLRGQLEIVESENAGLKKQIETIQRDGETRQMKVAGGNWDLEQATRRYQESQREIRRLGALLEEDRAKCKQEKKDIEYMLFDPEVAKPAQISMLTNLEDQVAAKDAKISELETALKSAKVQPAAGDASEEIKFVAKPAHKASETSVPASVEAAAKAPAVQSEKLLTAEVKPMTSQPVSAQPVKAPLPAFGAGASPVADAVPVQAPVPAPAVVASAAPQPIVPAAPAAVPFPLQPAPVAMAPAPAPVAAPAPIAMAPQPVPVAAPAEGTRFQTTQDFASILQEAGVTIRGAVQPVQKVSSATYKAYSWQTDSLYGSAEQRPMGSQTAFEPAVQQYIDRAKSRCKGDFAAVPAEIHGSVPAEGYEIACVSGQSGSSASVLFTYKDGIMTTVAHEGRAEAMDIAMDARDRVAAKITAN